MSAPATGVDARLERAVFIDRDGTLIEERHYLADPGGVELIAGSAAALRRLRRHGWRIVVVTNQSGIARGRLSVDDYHAVAARLDALLAAEGAWLDATCYCPHHPDVTGPCGCRKPAPGLLLAAARSLGVGPARSYMVGDKASDVGAGLAAGATPILVRSGYGRATEGEGGLVEGLTVVDSLVEAADWILAVESNSQSGAAR